LSAWISTDRGPLSGVPQKRLYKDLVSALSRRSGLRFLMPVGAGDRTRTHTPLGDTPELEKKDRRKPATIGDVPTSLSLRRRRILPLHFLLTREYANDA
jgi:hypothetical protein